MIQRPKVGLVFASVLALSAGAAGAQNAQDKSPDAIPFIPMFQRDANGMIRSFVLPEDYPRNAPAGAYGTVDFQFRITSDGRVSDCKVTRSSGYSILDDATCRAFIKRARFRPALDDKGQPIESQARTTMTWGSPRP